MEFFLQYKEIFSILLVGIVEVVILLICKKRPQVVDNSFLANISNWILEAEAKFKLGSDKLRYVLDKSKNYLGENFVENDVKALIEYVLTIPEKKEKRK